MLFFVRIRIRDGFPFRYLVQGRLGDINETALDDQTEVPIEEREKKRADVRTVHVCVGCDDDLVVSQLRDIKDIPDGCPERDDERADLDRREHAVDTRTLDVQYLAAQRQDGLRPTVSSLLRASACGIAFDDEEFGLFGTLYLAIGEFPRERHAFKRSLAKHRVFRRFCRLTRLKREQDLVHNGACVVRILLEEGRERFAEHGRDRTLRFHAPELRLRLAFELYFRKLHGENGCDALKGVIAGEIFFALPQDIRVPAVRVQGTRERGLEPRHVGTAFGVVGVVREREEPRRDVVHILERDFHGNVVCLAFDIKNMTMHRRLVLVIECNEGFQTAFEIEGHRWRVVDRALRAACPSGRQSR